MACCFVYGDKYVQLVGFNKYCSLLLFKARHLTAPCHASIQPVPSDPKFFKNLFGILPSIPSVSQVIFFRSTNRQYLRIYNRFLACRVTSFSHRNTFVQH